MPDIKVVRIKSTHPPSQGDFVEINESDFDAAVHELYEDAPAVSVEPPVLPVLPPAPEVPAPAPVVAPPVT